MWERPILQRVGFVAAGLGVGAIGAFSVATRGGGSVGRGLLAAVCFSLLGLAVGVLYGCGVPLIHPDHAPTPDRANVARAVRWPLAIGWTALITWFVATG